MFKLYVNNVKFMNLGVVLLFNYILLILSNLKVGWDIYMCNVIFVYF